MAQLRRCDAAALDPDLLVEPDELLADPGHDVRASGAHLLGLRLEVGKHPGVLLLESGEPVGDLTARGLELRHPLRQRLGPLHHLDLDVLELGLASGEGHELVLERGEVLRAALTGVEPGLVTSCTVPDELDVLLRLGQLALDVADGRASVDELGVDRRELAPGRRDRRDLGQVGSRMGDLVEPGVNGLQVEQTPLAGRIGFQDTPPRESASSRAEFAATTKLHGSVRMDEILDSTLVAADRSSPRAAKRRRSALASHSDSVAQ